MGNNREHLIHKVVVCLISGSFWPDIQHLEKAQFKSRPFVFPSGLHQLDWARMGNNRKHLIHKAVVCLIYGSFWPEIQHLKKKTQFKLRPYVFLLAFWSTSLNELDGTFVLSFYIHLFCCTEMRWLFISSNAIWVIG